MIIIQEIETTWSKKSREANKASIRNSVPEAFDIPNNKEDINIYQLYRYEEETEFKDPKIKIEKFNDKKLNNFFGALRLYYENNILKVKYTYSPENVGAPERTVYPKEVLSLKSGEWGRVIYTGRFCGTYSSYTEWFYKKEVFNIANIEIPNISIFTKTKPKKTFKDIANLR